MKAALALAPLALVVACAGGGRSARPGGEEPVPEWVSRGTGAFELESGKQLQAVGIAPPSDPRTRRQHADESAEQQMSSGIEALAAAVAKLTEGPAPADAVSALTKKAAGKAAAIRDHWVTPDGTEQSLEVLDLASFHDALRTLDGDGELKRAIAAASDRAFASLIRH